MTLHEDWVVRYYGDGDPNHQASLGPHFGRVHRTGSRRHLEWARTPGRFLGSPTPSRVPPVGRMPLVLNAPPS